ncbi:MAG: DUF6599 family protein [Armatimonadota bacterium]
MRRTSSLTLEGGIVGTSRILRRAAVACLALLCVVASAEQKPREDALRAKLASCLPGDDVAPGWNRVAGPEFYGPATLYEYIDGAAGLYQSYDFRRLAAASYQVGDDAKRSIVVELYEMGSPLQAFGIYSVERSPQMKPERIGTEGYVFQGSCNFYKGRVYAKLAARQRDGATVRVLRQFAARIAEALDGPDTPPEILKVFPSDNRVEMSERFIGAALLGHAFFPSGFLVDYRLGEKPSRLFLARFPDEGQAEAAYDRFVEFLRERGRAIEQREGPGDQAIIGEQPFYGLTLACRSGKDVCGIVRIPDESGGRRILEALLANLKAAAN